MVTQRDEKSRYNDMLGKKSSGPFAICSHWCWIWLSKMTITWDWTHVQPHGNVDNWNKCKRNMFWEQVYLNTFDREKGRWKIRQAKATFFNVYVCIHENQSNALFGAFFLPCAFCLKTTLKYVERTKQPKTA